jgi:ATP-dependent helicase HrpA
MVRRLALVEDILKAFAELLPQLHPPLLGFAKANYDDLREQLGALIHPGFARELPLDRLSELPRYLKAMALRAQRLQMDPRKDQARMIVVREFGTVLAALREAGQPALAVDLERLRWLIEEFRVQQFAQELKTREVVSEKRLRKLVESLLASGAGSRR